MDVRLAGGFGTRCSHCVAIPRDPGTQAPVFLFASGPPGRAPFLPLPI